MKSMSIAAVALTTGLLLACGGGDGGRTGSATGGAVQPAPAPLVACTVPPEGPMRVPPPAVMGGQIVGRSDGSFVLVSHKVWGIPRVVLLLGPDLPRQPTLRGDVLVDPRQFFCASSGGFVSNGWQTFGQAFSYGYVYLKLDIDPAHGLVSGTLRDVRSSGGGVEVVTGGPIAGSVFDAAAPPSIATAVGSWTLSDVAGQPGSLSLAADGSVDLTLAECRYSGTVAPASGLNLLDMKLLAQPGCLLDTYQTEGFIVFLPMTDGRQQLMIWGVDDGWGYEVRAIGSR